MLDEDFKKVGTFGLLHHGQPLVEGGRNPGEAFRIEFARLQKAQHRLGWAEFALESFANAVREHEAQRGGVGGVRGEVGLDGLGAEPQEFGTLFGLKPGLHELGQQDAEGVARHENGEQIEPVLRALLEKQAPERLGKPAAQGEHHFGVAAGLGEQAAEAVEQPQKTRERKGGAFGG